MTHILTTRIKVSADHAEHISVTRAPSLREAVIRMGTLAKNPTVKGVMIHEQGQDTETERAICAFHEPVSIRA